MRWRYGNCRVRMMNFCLSKVRDCRSNLVVGYAPFHGGPGLSEAPGARRSYNLISVAV